MFGMAGLRVTRGLLLQQMEALAVAGTLRPQRSTGCCACLVGFFRFGTGDLGDRVMSVDRNASRS